MTTGKSQQGKPSLVLHSENCRMRKSNRLVTRITFTGLLQPVPGLLFEKDKVKVKSSQAAHLSTRVKLNFQFEQIAHGKHMRKMQTSLRIVTRYAA